MKLNRTQNMLAGVAMGDAFGMTYEFLFSKDNIAENADFTKYKPKIKNGAVRREPGMYTDDTQMTLGIAELLASDQEFNHENLANSFTQCYQREPINGYSTRMENAFNGSTSGKDFLQKIDANTIRDGAAMRAVPFGVVNNIDDVVKYALISAEVDHNTEIGKASSVAVALMSHYNFNNVKDKSMFQYIEPHMQKISPQSVQYLKSVDKLTEKDYTVLFGNSNPSREDFMNGMSVAGTVLYLLKNYKNPMDVLKQAILVSGDTDTMAAVSLGISMINHSMDELPEFLLRDLTNHQYGRDYILNVGEKLAQKQKVD